MRSRFGLQGIAIRKWLIISGSLISGLIVIVLGGLTKSWAVGIDQRLERACHGAVTKRAPFGHRDIETTAYSDEDEDIGIAEGVMMARYDRTNWTKIAWTCHINPKSGRVVHSEVKLAGAGSKRP
ncbi:MAG: hypothetical protein ACRBM6_34335 [Geminicoccales bacterium]